MEELNNQPSDEKSKQIKSENQNLSLLSLSQKNNAQKDGSPPCRGKRDALPLCHETVSRERRRAGRGARQGDTSDCRTVALSSSDSPLWKHEALFTVVSRKRKARGRDKRSQATRARGAGRRGWPLMRTEGAHGCQRAHLLHSW